MEQGEFELIAEESTCPLEKVKTEDGWTDEIMAHMIRCKHCGQIFTCVVNTWRGSGHFKKRQELTGKAGTEMNQRDEAKLLEQLEQWNEADEFSRCIEAIEAIPERERGYLLTVMLSRAYSNLAVLGDHSTHGEDDEVDGNLIRYAIELAGVRPHPG